MRKGMSVAEVCQLAGIQETTLYRIESGKVPRITTVRKLAGVFGCDLEQLLEYRAPAGRGGTAA